MTISKSDGINPTMMAEQIQELIHQLSSELSKTERAINRDAGRNELEQSLEAAQHMRDKADSIKTGAFVSGAVTALSAGVQAYCATQIDVSGSEVAKAKNERVERWAAVAHDVGSIGGAVNQIFTAKGECDEALAQEAQARSKAASHQAEEAQANRQDANKVDEAAKELYQEIARNQHAGIMAIVARQ